MVVKLVVKYIYFLSFSTDLRVRDYCNKEIQLPRDVKMMSSSGSLLLLCIIASLLFISSAYHLDNPQHSDSPNPSNVLMKRRYPVLELDVEEVFVERPSLRRQDMEDERPIFRRQNRELRQSTFDILDYLRPPVKRKYIHVKCYCYIFASCSRHMPWTLKVRS